MWRIQRRLRSYPAYRECSKSGAVVCGALLFVSTILLLRMDLASPSYPTVMNDPVPVYVVEEHHEALKYWFQDLQEEKGGLPYTLIHIDAHSDMGLPFLAPDFPDFQLPQSEKQVSSMMQQNDVFILGAITTGLLDRVVWIYPSWDQTINIPYAKWILEIGTYMNLSTNQLGLCSCSHKLIAEGEFPLNESLCEAFVNEREIEMPKSECDRKRSAIIEVISEDRAMDLLRHRELFMGSKSNTILDIDEDFFACGSGYNALAATQLRVDIAIELNYRLSAVFCVKKIHHEEAAHRVLKTYIRKLIELCSMTTGQSRCSRTFGAAREADLDAIITDAYTADKSMFCQKNSKKTMKYMDRVLAALKWMTRMMLEAILEVGFCTETSLESWRAEGQNVRYAICHGSNVPNFTVVNLHEPTEEATKKRMLDLYTTLGMIRGVSKLHMVTLCRSVRDGYTPRHMASYIESGILDYFRKPENAESFQITHDKNLLGGERGWKGRY